MGSPQQVLQIEPGEIIKFNGLFTEIVTSELKLTNPTEDQIAFKVKTTAPRRYAVRPNSGVLHAGESVSVSVMRQPFEFDPVEKVRHKFMIQSVRMQPGHTLNTVWTEVDPSMLMDTRLRVQFDDTPPSNRLTDNPSPAAKEISHGGESWQSSSQLAAPEPPAVVDLSSKSSVSDEEYYRVRDENERLSREVDDLKSERQRLRSIAMSENTGAVQQQVPKGLSLIFREKTNVALIFVLLVVCFSCGVYLADQILATVSNSE